MNVPAPVLPRFGEGCLTDVVAGLCSSIESSPSWVPETARGAERVVLLVLDGLGWNQMHAHSALLPVLSRFDGGAITSVAPSTTATALTSLTTGLDPASHGIVGWRMLMGDTIMNVLRWSSDDGADLRRRYEPGLVQSCPPFLGMRVPVVSRAELEQSGFTAAHLAGVRHHGWRVSSSIGACVRAALDEGHTFVYAYYDGVDKVAHERGFGPHYEAELAHVDWLVAQVLSALPDDAVLVVTADHGQVHVGDAEVKLDPQVASLVRRCSGEGRFRWLHAHPGREHALLEACDAHAPQAWVVPREQLIDERWFGPRMSGEVRRRLGDVALVARDPVSFEDPAEAGGQLLVCRHGSLTADEMLVPLVAHRV